MDDHQIVVLVAVGPKPEDIVRLRLLLSSVMRHEPALKHLVLLDDYDECRDLPKHLHLPRACDLTCLASRRVTDIFREYGGLFVGLLGAMEWVAAQYPEAIVVKLDTDALVIRPFTEKLLIAFQVNPECGVAGVVGRTCNRAETTYGLESQLQSPLHEIRQLWNAQRCGNNEPPMQTVNPDLCPSWRPQFTTINNAILVAEENGYDRLRYCQGGAYAVSPRFLGRMEHLGYFSGLHEWSHFPVGEDVILGMYVYASGMKLLDLSSKDQIFGVRWQGLPFDPEVLLQDRYSIIHSLRGNPRYPEMTLYSFFANNVIQGP